MHLPKISTRSLALPLILALDCAVLRPRRRCRGPRSRVFWRTRDFSRRALSSRPITSGSCGSSSTLTEIPAPPFKEERRARAYLEMLQAHGLSDVEMDQEGNVMGVRKGSGGAPMLAVLAHLDTVFPEGTDVKVKREGTRLMAPGVGDDTRGLALMLAVIRAMNAAKFTTASDILFVGNVGEEGEGDLRGVKFLLQRGQVQGPDQAVPGDRRRRPGQASRAAASAASATA